MPAHAAATAIEIANGPAPYASRLPKKNATSAQQIMRLAAASRRAPGTCHTAVALASRIGRRGKQDPREIVGEYDMPHYVGVDDFGM